MTENDASKKPYSPESSDSIATNTVETTGQSVLSQENIVPTNSAGTDAVEALIESQPLPQMNAGTTLPLNSSHGPTSLILTPQAKRRIKRAKFGSSLNKAGYTALLIIGWLVVSIGIGSVATHTAHLPGLAMSIAGICFMLAYWWKHELWPLPAEGDEVVLRLSRDALNTIPLQEPISPFGLWQAIAKNWQARFFTQRLLIDGMSMEQVLSAEPKNTESIWLHAAALSKTHQNEHIEIGHIAAAILLQSPRFIQFIQQLKLADQDIESLIAWLSRSLAAEAKKRPRNEFGGIGRDWASGYTPNLDHFGHNVSLGIVKAGAHFDWLASSAPVQGMRNAFSQGTSAIALLGETGVGKTSHMYALAQTLIGEKNDRNLEHKQIVSLNASLIISSATQPGQLEYIVNILLNEAAHAGNIILFLDDAQLFFSNQTGSFNIANLLLPALRSRAIQLVLAMTPADFQRLKAADTSFASLITPIVVPEPLENDVMRILEDTCLNFEHRHSVFITYAALKECYRLSGRYEQEISYPGKAINLLEQSLRHARNSIVLPESVQAAIEETRGVKVQTANANESEMLLHLEEAIHTRMINQTHAVKVVANALRRARAGVASQNRPIGSFLFLGPTGVGKTELAKSIAAVFFGDEQAMIRLDMSEYQQPEDVKRILSGGTEEHTSLLLAIRQRPYGVVLLDEIEKAHPNVLNLLLQLLDEGSLTDSNGRVASFKDSVVIVTSNAGADRIREQIQAGNELESFSEEFTNELIDSGQFKPELLNRFDEIVLFRPLKPEELVQVVQLMVRQINQTLSGQNITVKLTTGAAQHIVASSYDPRLGARPMRRALQRSVEDVIAQKILSGETRPGDTITLSEADLTS